MTAKVRVAGILSHAPISRALKAGGHCVTATLKAKDGDHTQFWYVIAFSETVQAELMHLSDGDTIALQGSLKADLFDTGGDKRNFRSALLPRMSCRYASRARYERTKVRLFTRLQAPAGNSDLRNVGQMVAHEKFVVGRNRRAQISKRRLVIGRPGGQFDQGLFARQSSRMASARDPSGSKKR
jgi:hypothetical protein